MCDGCTRGTSGGAGGGGRESQNKVKDMHGSARHENKVVCPSKDIITAQIPRARIRRGENGNVFEDSCAVERGGCFSFL